MLRDRLFHAQAEAVQSRVGGSTSKTTAAAQIPAPKSHVMVSTILSRHHHLKFRVELFEICLMY